jgi:hypothetical protein
MEEVTYEVVAPEGWDNTAIENSPTRLNIDPGAPSPETIAKMERSLEQMKMLRKALKEARRIADPQGVKAQRKKKNRKNAAIAKASRRKNR